MLFVLCVRLLTMLLHVRAPLLRGLLRWTLRLGVPIVPTFSPTSCVHDLSLLCLWGRLKAVGADDLAGKACGERLDVVW